MTADERERERVGRLQEGGSFDVSISGPCARDSRFSPCRIFVVSKMPNPFPSSRQNPSISLWLLNSPSSNPLRKLKKPCFSRRIMFSLTPPLLQTMDQTMNGASTAPAAAAAAAPVTRRHLIVLQHGFQGSPWDMKIIKHDLLKLFQADDDGTDHAIVIHNSNLNNAWFETHEGIDHGGRALYAALVKKAAELGWVRTRPCLLFRCFDLESYILFFCFSFPDESSRATHWIQNHLDGWSLPWRSLHSLLHWPDGGIRLLRPIPRHPGLLRHCCLPASGSPGPSQYFGPAGREPPGILWEARQDPPKGNWLARVHHGDRIGLTPLWTHRKVSTPLSMMDSDWLSRPPPPPRVSSFARCYFLS